MRRAVINNIILDVVETEEPSYKNKIATHPIEKGIDITDHVQKERITFDFVGHLTGRDAEFKKSLLLKYMENAELVTFVGRNVFENMVIESLSPLYNNNNQYGFSFNVRLSQIYIVDTDMLSITGSRRISTQLNRADDRGLQQAKFIRVDNDIRSRLHSVALRRAGVI